MKRIVFKAFLEMIEARHSPAFLEDSIAAAAFPSNGVYSAVGAFPYTEIASPVGRLSLKIGNRVPALVQSCGEYVFDHFKTHYLHMEPIKRVRFEMIRAEA